ncbi:MAG: UDP-glucose 4-epimerase GalE [Candidatus Omnitrophica bacterium]|nr:UDP-glucose 4-epimerase GalE [Candidatus Omnitrophota bacterium]
MDKNNSNKNVLVVGGAGYIGSHMVRLLLEKGYKPLVFDNLSTGYKKFIPGNVELFKGDLKNAGDVRKVFEKIKISAVMHFASYIVVSESVREPLKYYENNVIGGINLLKQMGACGVDKFIFSSSAAVYGKAERVPIKENDRIAPINPYGVTKRMTEKILEDLASAGKIRYISLRYFNAAGAHASGDIGENHVPETHLIPNVLAAAKGRSGTVEVYGNDYPTPDGTCVRDYIHVMDLAEAHLLALRYLFSGGASDVFNLGCGRGYSVKEIILRAEKITRKNIRIKFCARRSGDSAKLIADNKKISKVLKWLPRRGLDEIIASAWRWELNKKGEKHDISAGK